MKTKLEMAHDYAMVILSNPEYDEKMETLIKYSWIYADAMQAEADKRLAEAEYKEEWQPDWSQAPEWANFIVMSKAGTSCWHANEPKTSGNGWVGGGLCDLDYMDFYHKGDWRD